MTDPLRRARNARYYQKRIADSQTLSLTRAGRPRTAKTYIGSPCKKCGNSIRYCSTQNCVDCQCHRHGGQPLTIAYGITPIFTQWSIQCLSKTLTDQLLKLESLANCRPTTTQLSSAGVIALSAIASETAITLGAQSA